MDMLRYAVMLAQEAGTILLDTFGNPQGIQTKPDGTQVSDADKQSSDFITTYLTRSYPHMGIVDEEQARDSECENKEYCWFIDPLDGTRAYIEGRDEWGLLIGLAREGKPYLCVAYQPHLNKMIIARQGKGAYNNQGNAIRVSTSTAIDTIITDRNEPGLDGLLSRIDPHTTTRMGSMFKMIHVACGQATAYVQEPSITLNLWDLCAPHLILTEAGGKLTDISGRPIQYTGGVKHTTGIVATNGIIHEELLRRLSASPSA